MKVFEKAINALWSETHARRVTGNQPIHYVLLITKTEMTGPLKSSNLISVKNTEFFFVSFYWVDKSIWITCTWYLSVWVTVKNDVRSL